ncbi:MAG TPA: hypothetical protein VJB57_19345 [Dehalococcoidia bacterium]|nr:hypothetical protein [Dehalococcoidia bacterium]
MPNIALAREEIGKAVACLVNRVGYEADVFRHLTGALAALKDKPVVIEEAETASTEAATGAASDADTESVGTAPPELATESEPSTKTTGLRRRK